MRELNECKAEVFRRSEKRIKDRRRARNRVLACCIPMCLIITLWSVSILPGMMPKGRDKADPSNIPVTSFSMGNPPDEGADGSVGSVPGGPPPFDSVASPASLDGFSFSLTWGCYGVSSYDSNTGKLVKTTDATNPEDYITTYRLTAEQKQEIYDLILNLDITSYPDTYNPHKDLGSDPSMTLILSVNTDTVQKTITAADIALTYESDDREGQKFLSVCKAIQDILTSTEEWKALPKYEFFYD